jgi:hypothetical protein
MTIYSADSLLARDTRWLCRGPDTGKRKCSREEWRSGYFVFSALVSMSWFNSQGEPKVGFISSEQSSSAFHLKGLGSYTIMEGIWSSNKESRAEVWNEAYVAFLRSGPGPVPRPVFGPVLGWSCPRSFKMPGPDRSPVFGPHAQRRKKTGPDHWEGLRKRDKSDQ